MHPSKDSYKLSSYVALEIYFREIYVPVVCTCFSVLASYMYNLDLFTLIVLIIDFVYKYWPETML